MDELVCLQCGKEMEYDWAPCPHCGWKAPGPWDASAEELEEGTPASRHAVLAKPKSWIRWTVLGLLMSGLLWWMMK